MRARILRRSFIHTRKLNPGLHILNTVIMNTENGGKLKKRSVSRNVSTVERRRGVGKKLEVDFSVLLISVIYYNLESRFLGRVIIQ